MSANAEIIAELRRVLNERDEAREQLDLTKRELGRWVDRETKAVRERDSYQRQLDAIGDAIVTSITKRIEPRISRHPVTVVMAAGSLIAKIGEAIGCEFEDGDDLLEAVKELVRECDEARAACPDCAMWAERSARWHSDMQRAERERDEARAEVERLRETKDCLRTWLSSEELEGLRVKAAEHPLLWEEIHHLKDEVKRLREKYDSVLEANVSLLDGAPYVDARAAFRRGAEAMRDAAANALDMAGQGTLCNTRECEHWGRYVRAQPIPEEE